jgi:hypothetical protein
MQRSVPERRAPAPFFKAHFVALRSRTGRAGASVPALRCGTQRSAGVPHPQWPVLRAVGKKCNRPFLRTGGRSEAFFYFFFLFYLFFSGLILTGAKPSRCYAG